MEEHLILRVSADAAARMDSVLWLRLAEASWGWLRLADVV